MRMFSTRPNRNGDGVTERFIDGIIANQANHIGLPLYADTKRLRNRDYANLDHQYDPLSGEFHTEEIGSFCAFEKAEDEYGVSLFGEARVYKRSAAVCQSLLELYSRQMLNVSFEIAYDTLLVIDGVEYIDASENNVITGMAIVSKPAYPEAFATRMVAEDNDAEHDSMANDKIGELPDNTEGVSDMTLDEAKNKIAELEGQVQELTTQ